MKTWSIPYNPSAFVAAESVIHFDKKMRCTGEKFVPGNYFLLQIVKKKFEFQQASCNESVRCPCYEIVPTDFLRLHELPKSIYAPQVIYVRTT